MAEPIPESKHGPGYPTRAVLIVNDGRDPIELDILHGTRGGPGLDVGPLYRRDRITCFDPGFLSTSSCRSAVSYTNGSAGRLTYRGYPIEEVARRLDYLETAELLLEGEVPEKEKAKRFHEEIARRMPAGPGLDALLAGWPRGAHPMSVLIGCVSSLAASHPEANEDVREAVLRMIARMPVFVAAIYRHSRGLPRVEPDASRSYAENVLFMMHAGEPGSSLPGPAAARALDVLLTLHAEHEQNASTTVVRACASTEANPYHAVAAGIAALSGPKHGGANESVMMMLEGLLREGGVKAIPGFIARVKAKEAGVRLMGFGHRVYKNFDPRGSIIRAICHELLDEMGIADDPVFQLACELERIALEDDYFVSRHLYPNIDFYSGIVQRALGFPNAFFTPVFAMGRTAGWCAQMEEALRSPDTRLVRPRQIYTGPATRHLP